ncbi:MAG: tetratricopeptide repeat protein [Chitinophagaceae bacterium]|nr:MAG: tetratricopeptide repeat protein [Chitinophagaceae bacterium]
MTIKRYVIFIGLLCLIMDSYSQHKYTDSLREVFKHARSDTDKLYALYDISFEYQNYKPDSALLVAQELYDFSILKKNLLGQSLALDATAGAYLRMGDNTKALEYYLQRLKLEEERKEPYNIASLYMNLANVYNRNKDTARATKFILRADSIIDANDFKELKVYAYLNSGNIFEKANRLPQALDFTLNSYQLALLSNDSLMIGSALNNLGNIYFKMNKFKDAIESYRRSQIFIIPANDNQTLTEGFLGLANTYASINKKDSALYFAKQAYFKAFQNGILDNALNASSFLTKYFESNKNYDSAFVYQTNMIELTDSIRSIENIKQLESLSIQEQLRQQQILAKELKEKEEHKQRLQMLAIGIAIPLFFFFSIYISRMKTHRKVIQFFAVLSLLLFFEYITLFLHPIVSEITHHNAFLEIIIFVSIGALLVPAHHKLEHWFSKHLAKNYETARFKEREKNDGI